MEENGLVILIVAFVLFIIFILVILFIYAKDKYNSKHLDDDYKREIDLEDQDDEN